MFFILTRKAYCTIAFLAKYGIIYIRTAGKHARSTNKNHRQNHLMKIIQFVQSQEYPANYIAGGLIVLLIVLAAILAVAAIMSLIVQPWRKRLTQKRMETEARKKFFAAYDIMKKTLADLTAYAEHHATSDPVAIVAGHFNIGARVYDADPFCGVDYRLLSLKHREIMWHCKEAVGIFARGKETTAGQEIRPEHVWLGNIEGIWTFTAAHFINSMQNRKPGDDMDTIYPVIQGQAQYMMEWGLGIFQAACDEILGARNQTA